MATHEQLAPFPMIELVPGMRIVFEAIDPTTGNTVANVFVREIAIVSPGAVGSGALPELALAWLSVPNPVAPFEPAPEP